MITRWVITIGLAALLIACGEAGPGAGASSAATTSPVVDEVRQVLQQSGAFRLNYDEAGLAGNPLVILIGENHASVAAQIQELWSNLVYADEIKRRSGWVVGSLLRSQISRLQRSLPGI